MKSLYIHIPFCKQKCFYCDFNSYSGKDNLIQDYTEAIKKEIASYFDDNKNKLKAETIYFGGGTPSLIPSEYIKELLDLVECSGEITLELNPGTITKEKLEDYYKIGINRLSIGLQATQNDILKRIGRIHTLKEFEETYKMARDVGFTNISVDLMFGLPGQTTENVEDSLDYIISKKPEHVSCYSLIVHDELVIKNPTAFENLPNDEEERKMYHIICCRLKEAGYKQYEISNFSKDGFESKHNLCYWNQEEYIGVGAGASSYINNQRIKNVDSIEKYISGESIHQIEEVQNEESKLREYMILQLRLLDGVDIEKAKNKFNVDVMSYFKNEIEKMQNYGLLNVENQRIFLTEKGLDLANIVWEEFI